MPIMIFSQISNFGDQSLVPGLVFTGNIEIPIFSRFQVKEIPVIIVEKTLVV